MNQQITTHECVTIGHIPWNKGRIIGRTPPLKPQDIWSIRVFLKKKKRYRDLALFNLAIDSKLRACDLVKLKTSDVVHGESVRREPQSYSRKRDSQYGLRLLSKNALQCSNGWRSLICRVIPGYLQVGQELRLISKLGSR